MAAYRPAMGADLDDTLRGRGVRLPWSAVPDEVRVGVERAVGSRIGAAEDREGGFSPGPAAVLTLADGTRVFVKAVGLEVNETSVAMHRHEGVVHADLPV